MRAVITGLRPKKAQRGRSAVIVRETGLDGLVPVDEHEFCGYPPHAFRHSASQLAEVSGKWWNDRHSDAVSVPTDPAAYAAALLDHGPREDRLRAVYGDRSGPAFNQVLSGRAIEGNWLQLTGDLGAQKTIDVSRWRRVVELKVALEEQRQFKRSELRDLLSGPSVESESNTGLRDALFEAARLEQEVSELAEQLQDVDQVLHRLQEDRSTWLVVPDGSPVPDPPDLQAIEAEVRGRSVPKRLSQDEPPARIRDWLTTTEFAECAHVNPATLSRWCNREHLHADDDRRPWGTDVAPIDDSLGLRYRRIAIDHVRPGFWTGQVMKQRLAAQLASWPKTKGWIIKGAPGPRCFAPLVLPSAYCAITAGAAGPSL